MKKNSTSKQNISNRAFDINAIFAAQWFVDSVNTGQRSSEVSKAALRLILEIGQSEPNETLLALLQAFLQVFQTEDFADAFDAACTSVYASEVNPFCLHGWGCSVSEQARNLGQKLALPLLFDLEFAPMRVFDYDEYCLVELDAWLKQKGYSLLKWHDSSRSFIVKENKAQLYLDLSQELGLENWHLLRDYQKPYNGFLVEEILPQGPTLLQEVRAAIKQAKHLGYKPYVCVMASWCLPCRLLRKGFEDPQVAALLKHKHILLVDADLWFSELNKIALPDVTNVPIIAPIGKYGKCTDDWLAFSFPEDNTPDILVREFMRYFGANAPTPSAISSPP